MPTTPEDADALFDLATPPAAPPTASDTPDAAAPDAGMPPIGADSRREQRVKVSWPARVQLPTGRVVELRVRDISDGGIGLTAPVALPSGVSLTFAMGVPSLSDPSKVIPVSGAIRVTYAVLKGHDVQCGGTWTQLAPEGRELIGKWIRQLRR